MEKLHDKSILFASLSVKQHLSICSTVFLYAPPKFNIAPEKRWLEDDPFLLGFGNFSGANC